VRGTPYLDRLEDTYVYQELSEVPHGQPKMADIQQASQVHPYKAAKPTQRAVHNTARLSWVVFSVLFLSCEANSTV